MKTSWLERAKVVGLICYLFGLFWISAATNHHWQSAHGRQQTFEIAIAIPCAAVLGRLTWHVFGKGEGNMVPAIGSVLLFGWLAAMPVVDGVRPPYLLLSILVGSFAAFGILELWSTLERQR